MPKAIVIEADQAPVLRDLDSFAACRDVIGGYIQYAPLDRGDVVLMVDEDGKMKGLPRNERADNWWGRNLTGRIPGDHLVGTCIIVGYDPASDNYQDVPENVAATLGLSIYGGRK